MSLAGDERAEREAAAHEVAKQHGEPEGRPDVHAPPEAARQAVPGSSASLSPKGLVAETTFRPAPRVPAPFRAARPSTRFVPVGARLIEERKNGADEGQSGMDEDGVLVLERQADITPTWVYGTILSVCVIGFFFSFVWWASPATVMTTVWRGSFLILMAVFALVGATVSVRLSRKERLVPKAKLVAVRKAQGAKGLAVRGATGAARGAKAYAVRRKKRVVHLVHQTKASVHQTGASLKASGTHFREGFHAESDPNFLVKSLHRMVRFGVWTYLKVRGLLLFLVRIVLGVLRLLYALYVTVVRVAWALYRWVAQPLLVLTFKVARWAVGVAYATGRGVLRLAWRVFYWLVRRWPLVYATQALESPVRVHVAPPLAATDVFMSSFLKVRVRPVVQEAAAPVVESGRLRSRTGRAERYLDLQEERREEFAERVVVVPPEDRWKKWREARRGRRAERREEARAAKQMKLDQQAAERALKQARKEADEEFKRRLKEAKKSGSKLKKDEKQELELQVLREYLPEEALQEILPKKEPRGKDGQQEQEKKQDAKRGRKQQAEKPKAGDEEAAEGPAEQGAPAAASGGGEGLSDEELEALERKRRKEERKQARMEAAQAKRELKEEQKARKQAEKDAKPVLKGRLRRMKREGQKPTKDERLELQAQIIRELTVKLLGREPKHLDHEEKGKGKKKDKKPKKKPSGDEQGPRQADGDADDGSPADKKAERERKKEEKARLKEEKKRANEEAKRAKQEEKERKKAEKEAAKQAEGGGEESGADAAGQADAGTAEEEDQAA